MDVRVVCATHQDLNRQIAENRFREDLFYRLAEIVIEIPPLRQRSGDAILLANAFLRRCAQEQRRGSMSFGDDALSAIERHGWPGNVRELLSAVRRAVIMCDGQRVTAADLGLKQPIGAAPAAVALAQDLDTSEGGLDLRSVREAADRQAVLTALARTDGNIARAAELLGVSRPTLYDLIHRLAIRQHID